MTNLLLLKGENNMTLGNTLTGLVMLAMISGCSDTTTGTTTTTATTNTTTSAITTGTTSTNGTTVGTTTTAATGTTAATNCNCQCPEATETSNITGTTTTVEEANTENSVEANINTANSTTSD
jgi:hypothetical protein